MSKWDGEFNGLPISIKTEKFGSDVEMADFFRNQQVNEDFYLLVGFWKDQKDNIVEEHLLKIKAMNIIRCSQRTTMIDFIICLTILQMTSQTAQSGKNKLLQYVKIGKMIL